MTNITNEMIDQSIRDDALEAGATLSMGWKLDDEFKVTFNNEAQLSKFAELTLKRNSGELAVKALPHSNQEYLPVLDFLLSNGTLADYDDELANRLQELRNMLATSENLYTTPPTTEVKQYVERIKVLEDALILANKCYQFTQMGNCEEREILLKDLSTLKPFASYQNLAQSGLTSNHSALPLIAQQALHHLV